MNVEKETKIFRGEEVSTLTDGIENVLLDFSTKPEKIVVFDADSMVHHCLYAGFSEELDEFGKKIKNPDYTVDDLEFLKGKLTEMYMGIVNKIEQYFTISALYIFIKGRGNFRKSLYDEYKANRPLPNPLINDLYNYFQEAHQAIPANGCEAEDYVATIARKNPENSIIVYLDHDLEEVGNCIFYNYQRNRWLYISEKEGKYNLYKKLTICEPGDNVNLTPKIGIKYFQKNFNIDFTDEQYEEALFQAYLKAWKGDEKIAREKMELAKKLLCLHEVDLTVKEE